MRFETEDEPFLGFITHQRAALGADGVLEIQFLSTATPKTPHVASSLEYRSIHLTVERIMPKGNARGKLRVMLMVPEQERVSMSRACFRKERQ
jgi:hypothetical protein